jgi:hypothetical protein
MKKNSVSSPHEKVFSHIWQFKPLLKLKKTKRRSSQVSLCSSDLISSMSKMFHYCISVASKFLQTCFQIHVRLREELSRCCLSLTFAHNSNNYDDAINAGLMSTTSESNESFRSLLLVLGSTTMTTSDAAAQLLALFARIDPLSFSSLTTSILDQMFSIKPSHPSSSPPHASNTHQHHHHTTLSSDAVLLLNSVRFVALSEVVARCSQNSSVLLSTLLIAIRKNLSLPSSRDQSTSKAQTHKQASHHHYKDMKSTLSSSLTICGGTFILAGHLMTLSCLSRGDREAVIQWVGDACMRTSEHSEEGSLEITTAGHARISLSLCVYENISPQFHINCSYVIYVKHYICWYCNVGFVTCFIHLPLYLYL